MNKINWRDQVTLSYPSPRFRSVPVERNPHHHGQYQEHDAFYIGGDWSTMGKPTGLSFEVQSGHEEPLWGERIVLYSTASHYQDIPWETNVPNKFAWFRNSFWRVKDQFLHGAHEYHGSIYKPCPNDTTAIGDGQHYTWSDSGFLTHAWRHGPWPPLTPLNDTLKCFRDAILKDPYDESTYAAVSDWFEERGDSGFAEQLRGNFCFSGVQRPLLVERKLRERVVRAGDLLVFKLFILHEAGAFAHK